MPTTLMKINFKTLIQIILQSLLSSSRKESLKLEIKKVFFKKVQINFRKQFFCYIQFCANFKIIKYYTLKY